MWGNTYNELLASRTGWRIENHWLSFKIKSLMNSCYQTQFVWFKTRLKKSILQVFCGKIPKDVFEDELIPLFEKCGKIWDLRLMMDPLTQFNRGYCFITFCTKEGAEEATKVRETIPPGSGRELVHSLWSIAYKISVWNLNGLNWIFLN